MTDEFYGGVSIEAQGSLFTAASSYSYNSPRVPIKRGVITTFSRKSRNRLLKKMARLGDGTLRAKFITLTYPLLYPNPTIAKTHLFSFIKRLRRLHPGWSGVWRIEYQARGAPHFHLLCFNLPFIHYTKIQKWWGQIIGFDDPFTEIRYVRNKRGVMFYTSKYMAKAAIGTEYQALAPILTLLLAGPMALIRSCWFISEPYLTVGRAWGVINSAALPWAIRKLIYLPGKPNKAFWDIRRYARKIWGKTNRARAPAGFTLFTDASYQLYNAFCRHPDIENRAYSLFVIQ